MLLMRKKRKKCRRDEDFLIYSLASGRKMERARAGGQRKVQADHGEEVTYIYLENQRVLEASEVIIDHDEMCRESKDQRLDFTMKTSKQGQKKL